MMFPRQKLDLAATGPMGGNDAASVLDLTAWFPRNEFIADNSSLRLR